MTPMAVRSGMFEPVARWIIGPDAEDRRQDGVCQTYEMFERYALERDKVLDDAILVHSRGVAGGRRAPGEPARLPGGRAQAAGAAGEGPAVTADAGSESRSGPLGDCLLPVSTPP